VSRAVVTGAAGFLGAAFADALRAAGWDVRGFDLRTGPIVEFGDVTRPDGWVEVLRGADLVVHAAAIVAETGDPRLFREVNVNGTATVARAAREAGGMCFLHLSSKVVYGRHFTGTPDEAAPVSPTGSAYTDTKIAAEHAALAVAAGGGLDLRIVRLGDVYGPGSVPWTIRPLRLLRRRLFLLPDGGRGILTPTYVDDAIEGALAVADAARATGEVFNITGGRGVSVAEFVAPYAAALGVPLRSAPRIVVRTAAGVLERGATTVGLVPPFGASTVEYLTHPGTYDISKVVEVVGWRPAADLDEGMRRTLEWARRRGLVP
jgi:2-alkyl-3-oxoalkanoate reductase